MKNSTTFNYQDVISTENLCEAWREFVRGKAHKKDVAAFALELPHNIILLHDELKNKTYAHGDYAAFTINDPKPRNIHKATVRDRLLHHALYRILYPYFDTKFIADSYSCRNNKGTHKALDRFRSFSYKVSHNHTRTAWVLKCDIKKFFASIDHVILLKILAKHIPDQDILWLLCTVIGSFHSSRFFVGLPLGNLTSQLLVNIYMNEFDQFMKHTLKVKHYLRYADDFAILSHDKTYLTQLLPQIRAFLKDKLQLELHPHKVSISTVASGVDFLGWVHFPDHRVLRAATKLRMLRNINQINTASYLGLLAYGNTYHLSEAAKTLLSRSGL